MIPCLLLTKRLIQRVWRDGLVANSKYSLAETLNLIPSIHSRQFVTVSNYRGSLAREEGSDSSTPDSCITGTHVHIPKVIHTYKQLQAIKWLLFLKDINTLLYGKGGKRKAKKGPLSCSEAVCIGQRLTKHPMGEAQRWLKIPSAYI